MKLEKCVQRDRKKGKRTKVGNASYENKRLHDKKKTEYLKKLREEKENARGLNKEID